MKYAFILLSRLCFFSWGSMRVKRLDRRSFPRLFDGSGLDVLDKFHIAAPRRRSQRTCTEVMWEEVQILTGRERCWSRAPQIPLPFPPPFPPPSLSTLNRRPFRVGSISNHRQTNSIAD